MTLDDYQVVLYRNQPDGWVAEVPSIPGCYALMPTRASALAELESVFEMIAAEHRERGVPLPTDTTEILHAWRARRRVPPRRRTTRIPEDTSVWQPRALASTPTAALSPYRSTRAARSDHLSSTASLTSSA